MVCYFMKFGQKFEVDMVPLLTRIFSRPPIPTMQPAGALSINLRLAPIKR